MKLVSCYVEGSGTKMSTHCQRSFWGVHNGRVFYLILVVVCHGDVVAVMLLQADVL